MTKQSWSYSLNWQGLINKYSILGHKHSCLSPVSRLYKAKSAWITNWLCLSRGPVLTFWATMEHDHRSWSYRIWWDRLDWRLRMLRLSSHLGQGLPAMRILFLYPGHQVYTFPNSLGNPSMCYPDIFKLQLSLVTLYLNQWSPTFLVPGTSFLEESFSVDQMGRGRFLDDSDTLHFLCTLFLLLVLSVPPQIIRH